MYKFKLLLITAIAVVGALLIYNHFEKKKSTEVVVDKFSSEYNLVSEQNIFKYSTLDEILDIFESKTGIIFFCTPESNWCNYYASYLNEVLKENNVTEVYYYNLKSDRDLNSLKYQRLLEILSPYIYKDDTYNSKIYMPDLTIVKDGQIIAHDNETSLVASDIIEADYWNDARIQDFKNKITNYVNLLNE